MDRGLIPLRTSSLNSATSIRQHARPSRDFEEPGQPSHMTGTKRWRDETLIHAPHSGGHDSPRMGFSSRVLLDGFAELEESPRVTAGPDERAPHDRPWSLERKRRLTASDDQRSVQPGRAARNMVDSCIRSGQQGFGSMQIPTSSAETPKTVIDLTEGVERRSSALQTSNSSADGILLPRWQPDSEAVRCPVCGNLFSFWYRKHHCRKCGRVVCANCSPHRITIPRQFIVHSPTSTLTSSAKESVGVAPSGVDGDERHGSSEGSSRPLNQALGGGEEVRVCNPCVPDPNFDPPPQQSRPHVSPSYVSPWPAFSTFGQPTIQPQAPLPAVEQHPQRSRRLSSRGAYTKPESVDALGQFVRWPINSGSVQTRSHHHRPSLSEGTQLGTEGVAPSQRDALMRQGVRFIHALDSAGPLRPPRSNSLAATVVANRASAPQDLPRAPIGQPWRLPPLRPGHLIVASDFQEPRHASAPQRQAEPPMSANIPPTLPPLSSQESRRRIKEDDECPVCGNALPPKVPDEGEGSREQHIELCIRTHLSRRSDVSLGATDSLGHVGPSSAPATASVLHPRTPTNPSVRHLIPGQEPLQQSRGDPDRIQQQRDGQQQPHRPHRATGNRMLVYRATEKDCMGEDGEPQECVICFDEFEVGDEMARLECLCKFHRLCIRQWWETKGTGSCPTHQLQE